MLVSLQCHWSLPGEWGCRAGAGNRRAGLEVAGVWGGPGRKGGPALESVWWTDLMARWECDM